VGRALRLWGEGIMSGRFLAVAVAVVLLAGCAGFNRILSYGNGWADGMYNAQGKRFEVWMHPKDNTILLNGSIGNAFGKGLASGATFGLAGRDPNYSTWMAGAKALLDPVGCKVLDLRPLQVQTSWEFDFDCPPGVDLRRLMREQREALRDGKPLDLAK
jgi:hypothetical protein